MLPIYLTSVVLCFSAPAPLAAQTAPSREIGSQAGREGVLQAAPSSLCASRHIHSGYIVEFDVGTPDAIGGFVFSLPTPQGELVVSVAPRSVRAEGFRIVVSPKPGVFEEISTPPVTTVRGGVRNVPGARVVGSIVDGDLSAIIAMPDGTRYAVEPFGEVGGAHLLYDTALIIDSGKTCGAEHDRDHGKQGIGDHEEFGGEGGVAGGSTRWVQVAVDVDYPFYLEHGGNPVAVARRVEQCFATANMQYDSQCNIEHLVTGLVIRTTAAADPYDLGEPCTRWPNESGMNWDVQGQWRNSPPQPFARDAVMLFTGRSHGSTIGCAFEDSICNENIFMARMAGSRQTGSEQRRYQRQPTSLHMNSATCGTQATAVAQHRQPR
ncbi:MAG: M12 family metallo-peptidase [Limnohabitans sp.]|jgi:hypothetical protein|nr:M12 family metallo-peptidase [Limnohabitans sp.]